MIGRFIFPSARPFWIQISSPSKSRITFLFRFTSKMAIKSNDTMKKSLRHATAMKVFCRRSSANTQSWWANAQLATWVSATCVATSFATGETSQASYRKLSQRLIAKVEPGSTFATACIATWDATCIATWETQVASWALAYHVCFPLVLVALDLRQNSINRPSLALSQRFFHSINRALLLR